MDSVTEYTDFLERQLLLNPTPENAHALAAVYRLRDVIVEREGSPVVHRDVELTTDERALEEGVDEDTMHWEKFDGSMGIWGTPDYDAVNSAFDPFELEHIISGSVSADELSTMSTSTAAKSVAWVDNQPDIIIAEESTEEDAYDDIYSMLHPESVPFPRKQIITFPKATSVWMIDESGVRVPIYSTNWEPKPLVLKVSDNGSMLELSFGATA
jgi:hypothetical protein